MGWIPRFIRLESAGGLVLMAAAILAMAIANSPLAGVYADALALPIGVRVGTLELAKSLRHWIDDGLMAIFFLHVGLELKREVMVGELSRPSKVVLPVAAAFGGMAAPAAVYALLNHGNEIAMRGWAIPMATDIAFALGVIALLGKRVPLSLKVFLTAIAIADDIGAILVIAFAYTEHLSIPMLQLAAVATACLVAMNLTRVTALSAYVVVGAVLWYLVLKSGVHATVAGVVTAFAIPLRTPAPGDTDSPLLRLEQGLHPWVAFGVLPVFAFANAGVPFTGAGLDALAAPIPLGIVAGLVAGKVIGVFGASALLVALRLARLPEGAGWLSLLGIAAVCGVGFTMSLFIGTLAFDALGDDYMRQARIGVIVGSVISGCIGALLLALGSHGRLPPSPGRSAS